MLAELKASMLKIRNLFRPRSLDSTDQQRWRVTFSKKLSQRQMQLDALSLQLPQFPHETELCRVTESPAVDLFSSLESPTTPYGIKAFTRPSPPSKPLSEHLNDGNEIISVSSLSEIEDIESQHLVSDVNAGLAFSLPKSSSLGTGGVYFFPSMNGDSMAVFKPMDEEPRGINNPKGYEADGEGLRNGVHSGEGAVRECAAFLLDHGSISGVPTTVMATVTANDLEKIGSLQRYISFDYDAEECGTGLFSVEQVHKICLADLRYANTDRNGQNILVTKEPNGTTTLTPIDHGYCFPDNLSEFNFEWMYWPQARHPFNPEIRKFIEASDPVADLEFIGQHDIVFRKECQQVFLFVNYCLKWAVRRNCTPRDIAVLLTEGEAALGTVFQMAHELSHGLYSESEVYTSLDCHAAAIMAIINHPSY